jgi:hypothetical protein
MAREPETDELEEPETEHGDETLILGSQDPDDKPRRSRLPFFILLILLLVGGGIVIMNPDLLLNMLGGGNDMPAPPAPEMPVARTAPAPAPTTPPPAPTAPAVVPPPSVTPAPTPSGPAPSASTPSAPPANAPAMPPPAPKTAAPAPLAPAPATTVAKGAPSLVPTPAFGEGQRVTVKQDPGSPAGIGLSLDSAGVRPGPLVRTGAILTVLDAELQNTTWIYSVKAEDGTRGWISEKHLAAAR